MRKSQEMEKYSASVCSLREEDVSPEIFEVEQKKEKKEEKVRKGKKKRSLSPLPNPDTLLSPSRKDEDKSTHEKTTVLIAEIHRKNEALKEMQKKLNEDAHIIYAQQEKIKHLQRENTELIGMIMKNEESLTKMLSDSIKTRDKIFKTANEMPASEQDTKKIAAMMVFSEKKEHPIEYFGAPHSPLKKYNEVDIHILRKSPEKEFISEGLPRLNASPIDPSLIGLSSKRSRSLK